MKKLHIEASPERDIHNGRGDADMLWDCFFEEDILPDRAILAQQIRVESRHGHHFQAMGNKTR
jgi:hypothetical protein